MDYSLIFVICNNLTEHKGNLSGINHTLLLNCKQSSLIIPFFEQNLVKKKKDLYIVF